MRWLILSDIHGNLEALDAVLDAATADGFDHILCCGDVVGYGADPNAVTAIIRSCTTHIVRGNHDKACVGLDDLEWFNPAARHSAVWTQSVLDAENTAYLRALPRGPFEVGDPTSPPFQIMHGSPLDEDEYLMQSEEALMMMGYLDTRISFFGHTHVQGGFRFHHGGVQRLDPKIPSGRLELVLDLDSFYLINPGSVGQPRDGDPRAAWALYTPEDRSILYRRVAYDFRPAQRKIIAAGLPPQLAYRIALGR
ncbi:MAG: metallophosphoesterase family protein [Acidobacteriia bacterium]|nr:metallophosphoesterase family protein [Terriglobia bacterium]